MIRVRDATDRDRGDKTMKRMRGLPWFAISIGLAGGCTGSETRSSSESGTGATSTSSSTLESAGASNSATMASTSGDGSGSAHDSVSSSRSTTTGTEGSGGEGGKGGSDQRSSPRDNERPPPDDDERKRNASEGTGTGCSYAMWLQGASMNCMTCAVDLCCGEVEACDQNSGCPSCFKTAGCTNDIAPLKALRACLDKHCPGACAAPAHERIESLASVSSVLLQAR